MNILSFLPDNLIFLIPSLLIALTIHEFAHAYISYRLGDPTPGRHGRLTLNPLAHIDPFGLLMLVFFRFGWGRPVEVDPSYYRDRRKGTVLVSLAGPASNVITSFVLILTYVILHVFVPRFGFTFWGRMLEWTFSYNVFIALFNLLPIPPLDGSKILAGLLPGRYSYKYQVFVGQWSMFILFALIATGLTGRILLPLSRFLMKTMFTIVYTLVGAFV